VFNLLLSGSGVQERLERGGEGVARDPVGGRTGAGTGGRKSTIVKNVHDGETGTGVPSGLCGKPKLYGKNCWDKQMTVRDLISGAVRKD